MKDDDLFHVEFGPKGVGMLLDCSIKGCLEVIDLTMERVPGEESDELAFPLRTVLALSIAVAERGWSVGNGKLPLCPHHAKCLDRGLDLPPKWPEPKPDDKERHLSAKDLQDIADQCPPLRGDDE